MPVWVSEKIPAKQIRGGGKEALRLVEEFFAANPRRRVCRLGWYYGEVLSVRRKHVQEDINAAVESAIRHNGITVSGVTISRRGSRVRF